MRGDKTMNEKMKSVIDTSLEVLEIYANRILTQAKENLGDPVKMERDLRTINVIGSDMERLQRLQMQKPLRDFDS